ncbi:MAG TPA: FtsX-like permease family protein [Streptosporangiaceae bacterium]|nr:FtsX-like permease family protein [Streptosporangiaceae bacterium]
MSTALRDPPDLDAGAGGGIVARRAVFRWGWRLFRREWRQQLLVLGLLAVAVAATIWGSSVVTNAQLPNPNYATLGTAAASVTLPGSDPHLAADIAAIQDHWGPADLIESQDIATGAAQPVQLRAESPHGLYNAPLLGLVSGSFPAGPGQVALTSAVAALYGTRPGGTWRAAGTTWRVTGIVQNPSNLADEFALAAPGQVPHPSQVTMLLGPAAAQQAISTGNGTLPGVPAATVSFPTGSVSKFSPATVVLVVEVLGLVFIGLVSVAGFSVMAQRRLRALGMLKAIGATERHLRLVMVVNGLAVGVTGALAGTVLGLAAWFAYVPALQQATGHVVDAAQLPWWAFALGVVFAVATSVLAARRPAKTMAAVAVATALSGRPATPRAVHRTVLPGLVVFAVGVVLLATAGGLAGASGNGGSPALHLVAGLVAAIIGIVLLAPLAISMLRASSRLPVAIRVALRDLVRYRARSGAALAATTFAVFLATGICIIASVQFENVLAWTGPNLSSSQAIIYAQPPQNGPDATALTSTQLAEVSRHVSGFAASLHARSAVPLESADTTLHQVGAQAHKDFTGTVYVATPQLLAAYGITAGQIAPGTDVLTMRPGMAGLPHMVLAWGNYGVQQGPGGLTRKDSVLPSCTLSSGCLANPRMQTVSSLPGGTSAPNTVITEYAVSTYQLQTHLAGWLIQAPAPLTAAQVNAARQFALAYGGTVETKSGSVGPGEIADGATVLGIVIALGVLAMSVGLIRSETAPDLRTLTATGASAATRRMITAATAAALGLLGAILGMAGAVIAGVAWARSSLSVMFGDVPLTDVLILLVGLPLIAAAGGWLFAGRKPPAVARQPIE